MSGTPNSLMVTCFDGETRALRASRSCHERRIWARWARERGGGETTAVAHTDPADSMFTSTRWWREPRACRLVGALSGSNLAKAAGPTQRRVDAVICSPDAAFWWHRLAIGTAHATDTDDNGEGLPHRPRAGSHRRALRCSCGRSALPAGHRSVPSGWRGSSTTSQVLSSGGPFLTEIPSPWSTCALRAKSYGARR